MRASNYCRMISSMVLLSLVGFIVVCILPATTGAQELRERAAEDPPNLETATFFVSPHGNDTWSGKLPDPRENDGPFATVARARDAIRALPEDQPAFKPARVLLRGGTYFLDSPLEFGPEDSGTPNAAGDL